MRRCILAGSVAKPQEYCNIPVRWRLTGQAPQHLKMQIYFDANPFEATDCQFDE
jgi:hypothetical protein